MQQIEILKSMQKQFNSRTPIAFENKSKQEKETNWLWFDKTKLTAALDFLLDYSLLVSFFLINILPLIIAITFTVIYYILSLRTFGFYLFASVYSSLNSILGYSFLLFETFFTFFKYVCK